MSLIFQPSVTITNHSIYIMFFMDYCYLSPLKFGFRKWVGKIYHNNVMKGYKNSLVWPSMKKLSERDQKLLNNPLSSNMPAKFSSCLPIYEKTWGKERIKLSKNPPSSSIQENGKGKSFGILSCYLSKKRYISFKRTVCVWNISFLLNIKGKSKSICWLFGTYYLVKRL